MSSAFSQIPPSGDVNSANRFRREQKKIGDESRKSGGAWGLPKQMKSRVIMLKVTVDCFHVSTKLLATASVTSSQAVVESMATNHCTLRSQPCLIRALWGDRIMLE